MVPLGEEINTFRSQTRFCMQCSLATSVIKNLDVLIDLDDLERFEGGIGDTLDRCPRICLGHVWRYLGGIWEVLWKVLEGKQCF